ncbi:MAG: 50S ribosomal protein L25 [Candidatus Liptonbacteria bacterium]|nr:50S ribosomal protein L25 [Candidatus Liptonbacteria bacterium]
MELSAKKREKFGKALLGLRAEGYIPAELYGRGIENAHLAVSAKEFSKALKEAGESTVLTVNIDGDKRPVLIYDIDRDPVRDTVTHVDFYQVRMDEKIKTRVPLEFIGIAPGVKEKNGILVKAMHELEVEALPGDLPHKLEVDMAGLVDIGSSFYVRDLAPIKGVEFLADQETVIASINAKVTEEEEAAMAAPATIDEVKVETEEEKAKREASKTTEGETPAITAPAAKKE